MRNLVFCPVGNPLTFDARFDKDNHWRYTKDNRNYETFVLQYSEFKPEDGTYDGLAEQRGFKWNLAKEYLEKLEYKKYEYVAFFDDDLITDIQNLNRAFELAKERDLKISLWLRKFQAEVSWFLKINFARAFEFEFSLPKQSLSLQSVLLLSRTHT
jgi:hypothetical protein